MSEIIKLRQRLKNVNKQVTEYRMTVAEARSLLAEIDQLTKQQEKPHTEVVLNEPAIITRTIDGGSL